MHNVANAVGCVLSAVSWGARVTSEVQFFNLLGSRRVHACKGRLCVHACKGACADDRDDACVRTDLPTPHTCMLSRIDARAVACCTLTTVCTLVFTFALLLLFLTLALTQCNTWSDGLSEAPAAQRNGR